MDDHGFRGEVHPTLNIFYECEVLGAGDMAGDAAAELAWLLRDTLPNVAFASARQILANWPVDQVNRVEP